MITDLRVGDYIENSELDEKKYNDIVEVFEQWGFKKFDVSRFSLTLKSCIGDGSNYTDGECKRKLTYSDIMSLKKVDVDNCNIDKVVSEDVIRPYDPRAILQSCKNKELESLSRFITGDDELIDKGELLKLRAAADGLIRLGYVWDEEEKAWCKINKEFL